ncbi:tetratricopeptide repeat protein [Dactylosporangium sp. NPDC049525]|uniref:ATP-binding protein n=1 Tax=Dactylosporangium sp. NPDC049525 TaxID=3154730 RepID=UPI003432F5A5
MGGPMFSAEVRTRRQRLGMSQEELAARTGVSVRSIRGLEGGRIGRPQPRTVRLLADAFELAGAERDSFCQSALKDTDEHQAGPVSDHAHAPPARGRPVPAQLPADVAGFVGRTDHLGRLTKLLDNGDGPAAVVISAIAGTAGVGKTALAVHWAHQSLDRFPDGQLYVNLRGYDPDQPATAEEVLARFLTALGVPGPDIPADVAEREARYRTELAGRRMLIVLDNAATVDQVRPLLPGTASSMVLVTSRDSLAGLVAVHGARRLDLDLLSPHDAVTLLRQLIGDRVAADPGAAAALAAQCARLPLALRVAAELAVARDTTPLCDLVVELADQQQRLDLLDAGGDPRAAVAAVFSWSMRHLPTAVVRTFRLLGLHPGPDVDAWAVAALTGTELPLARRALDRLARAHLVHSTGPGRYGMHDLLRAYAGSLAADAPDTERTAASTRLFDYYLAAAASAMVSLQLTGDTASQTDPPVHATPTPEFGEPEAARRWLDTERSCLVAAAAHTATHGWPIHTVRLSRILYRYLEGGPDIDALAIHRHAHDAARQTGDLAGQAHALLGLGTINFHLDRLDAATEAFVGALALWRQAGDPVGEARVLNNLGAGEARRGRYQAAAEHYEQAMALHRRAGDQDGEARVLSNLAVVEERIGRYQSAADRLERALMLYRQLGGGHGEATVRVNLGLVAQRQGRYPAAADHYQQALALFGHLGYSGGEAWALDGLGAVHTRLDQPDQATAYHQQALAIFKKSSDRHGEARALNGLGEAALAGGRLTAALTQHTTALTASPAPDQQARAHTGLGHAHQALGDLARARQHYEQALVRYTDLGSPDADDVRVHLAALDSQAGADRRD